MRRLTTAFVYFLLMYACGFATGVIREFLVTPRTGLTLALWIELPVMVGASFFVARFVLRHFGVRNEMSERLVMGLLGLSMLLAAEEAMSWALRGVSIFTLWTRFFPLAAIANFSGLALFALMPVLIGLQSGKRHTQM
jgi:hypothetical protein